MPLTSMTKSPCMYSRERRFIGPSFLNRKNLWRLERESDLGLARLLPSGTYSKIKSGNSDLGYPGVHS